MISNIEILEHLSYINECILIDATGEAKTELSRLIDKLVSDNSIFDNSHQDIITKLQEAQLFYLKDNYSKAASTLSSVIRNLWDAQLNSKQENKDIYMKINSAQRIVLFCTAIVIIAMFLYPPFTIPRANINPGYGFILSPPESGVDGNSISLVNTSLLLIQYLGVITVSAIAFLLFKDND